MQFESIWASIYQLISAPWKVRMAEAFEEKCLPNNNELGNCNLSCYYFAFFDVVLVVVWAMHVKNKLLNYSGH